MTAACNSARYLENGEIISVPGEELLRSARASNRFPTMRLEALPNRDSLIYRDLYGIPSVGNFVMFSNPFQANTLCRGTLRYEGWSNIMYALKALGLFGTTAVSQTSWGELLKEKLGSGNADEKLRKFLVKNNIADVDAAIDAIKWLHLLDDVPLGLPNQI